MEKERSLDMELHALMLPTLRSVSVSSHCIAGDRGLLGQACVISLSQQGFIRHHCVKKYLRKIYDCSRLESLMAWPINQILW